MNTAGLLACILSLILAGVTCHGTAVCFVAGQPVLTTACALAVIACLASVGLSILECRYCNLFDCGPDMNTYNPIYAEHSIAVGGPCPK